MKPLEVKRPLNCKERDKEHPDYCNYKECMGHEWYDYGDIKYCGFEVIWIIQNAEELRQGGWPLPPEHLEVDRLKEEIIAGAYYEKAICIVAEVDARLKRTGKDGKWLVSLIIANFLIPEDIRPLFDPRDIDADPKLAFDYITGYHRYGKDLEKWQPYSGWKKQRVYRGKNETGNKIFKKY